MAGWLSIADFVVVQDYFMTRTAQHAHLILPASFPIESGGSYTNTQKVIQEFEPGVESKVARKSFEQLIDILDKLGYKQKSGIRDILGEALSLLPESADKEPFKFNHTSSDNYNRMYRHGCDIVVKKFEEEFQKSLEPIKPLQYERIQKY